MYNNAIDGVSLTGNRFFYVNRLASAGDGRDARWERASLECCPPNLVRFLAGMPGLVYAQDTRSQAIYVNLYVSSGASFDVRGGKISLQVDSEMPWDGTSHIVVSTIDSASGGASVPAAIKLRMPGWTRNSPAPGELYHYLDRLDARLRCRQRQARQRSCTTSWATSRSIASGRKATPSPSSFRFSRDGSSLTIGSLTRGAGCRSSAVRLCTARSGRTSTRAKRSTCSSLAMRRCERPPTRVPSGKPS